MLARSAFKVCRACGRKFSKSSKISLAQWEARQTCSHSCSRQLPIRERLMTFVDRQPGPLSTECWIWTGVRTRPGYGRIIVKRDGVRRQWAAHRLAYFEFVGTDPGELIVMHQCDTPACINPEHLSLGTAADNAADRESKGRGAPPRGEHHPNAKLTPDQVETIMAGGSPTALAAQFGVSVSLIYKVRQGRAWRKPDA